MKDLNVGINPEYCLLLLVNFVLFGSLSVCGDYLASQSVSITPGSELALFPLELPSCRSNGGQQTSMTQTSQ